MNRNARISDPWRAYSPTLDGRAPGRRSAAARHVGMAWRTSPNQCELRPIAAELKGISALRSVALEIPISPVKGLSSSKTRKIAPANDSAQTNREAVTIKLVSANNVKLTKIALSQKIRIIKNGVGIEPPVCVNNCNRICAASVKA